MILGLDLVINIKTHCMPENPPILPISAPIKAVSPTTGFGVYALPIPPP